MTATFRAASTANFASASSTITKPAGVVQNDVQFLLITCDGGSNTLGVSGGAAWTQVNTQQQITNGDTGGAALFWQVAGASEPATYTITNSGGSATSAQMVAYSGVNTSTPIDVSSVNNPNSASPPASPVTLTGTSITTTANNETLLFFGFIDWNSSTAAAFTDPSGYTNRVNNVPAQFSNGLISEGTQASSGATGSVTATGTLAAASGNFVAWLVAVKDAVGSGPTINTQPQSQTQPVGATATFTVSATTSGGALSYQWRKNGSNVGTNSSSYTTPTLDMTYNQAIYDVLVTDSNGTTTSQGALLTVVIVPPVMWLRA